MKAKFNKAGRYEDNFYIKGKTYDIIKIDESPRFKILSEGGNYIIFSLKGLHNYFTDIFEFKFGR
jgi:hypothetical protein